MTRVLGLFAVLLTTTAFATTVWRGDFETGDTSQWSKTQAVSADRLSVVSSPVREGQYALKATVRQGDDPIGASGNRNELVYFGNEAVGSEYYYKWSTLFPDDYPSEKTWQLFAQWHHFGCCGSPPLQFIVNGEQIMLAGVGKTVWTAPLERGKWYDFIMHAKWSPDPAEGFLELWVNGEKVVPRMAVATMFPNDTNYLKLGLYRNSTIAPVGVVYHDGFTMATALEDVLPAQASRPPEPVPPEEALPSTEPPATQELMSTTDNAAPASEQGSLELANSGAPASGGGGAGGGCAATGLEAPLGLLGIAWALRLRKRRPQLPA